MAIADVNSDHHQDLIVTASICLIFLGTAAADFTRRADFNLDLKGHSRNSSWLM